MDMHKLQELWTSQGAVSPLAKGNDRQKDTEKRVLQQVLDVEAALRKSLRYRAAITGLCTVYFVTLAFLIDDIQTVTIVGYGLAIAVMLFYFVSHWRNQVRSTADQMSTTGLKFLQHIHRQYRFRKHLAFTGVFVYGVLLAVAIFLGTVQFTAKGSLTFQLVVYGLTFSWIIIGTYWMYRKQSRYYREEIEPVLEGVEALIEEWKGD